MNAALDQFWKVQDERYFRDHPDRKAHIRNAYTNECRGEFWSLGDHDKSRRRIILTRVDFAGNFFPNNTVYKLPFLAYSDETIADRDDVLLPLIAELVTDAAKREGLIK